MIKIVSIVFRSLAKSNSLFLTEFGRTHEEKTAAACMYLPIFGYFENRTLSTNQNDFFTMFFDLTE